MSFTVKFYSFAKKENSTAQPTGGSTYNCQLKAPCGILTPRILLDLGPSTAPSYNYAYISSFGRYYYVREWTNEGPLWAADLECDVLASYKSQIGSSTLYALRSSYTYDGDIVDALYPCKADVDQNAYQFGPLFLKNPPSGGLYCVGIVASGSSPSDSAARVGSLKYYFMDIAGLTTLVYALLDTATLSQWLDVNNASIELQKSLIDPLSYIKTCVWLPIAGTDFTPSISLSSRTIYINGWPVTGVNSAPVDKLIVSKQATVSVPQHPDKASRGGYLNGPGYTQLWLTAAPYGDISIDTNITAYEASMTVAESIDVMTGQGMLYITCGGVVIAQNKAMRGVNIQLSQIITDYVGSVSAAAGGVAGAFGAAMLGDIAGAIGSAVGGIANTAKAAAPKLSSAGGGGGTFLDNINVWSLNHIFFRPVADDNSHHGRPLCQNIQISNYPGYLLIQDADVSIACTAEELSKIRSYLEAGFYYE